jgi:hypothetical protein
MRKPSGLEVAIPDKVRQNDAHLIPIYPTIAEIRWLNRTGNPSGAWKKPDLSIRVAS